MVLLLKIREAVLYLDPFVQNVGQNKPRLQVVVRAGAEDIFAQSAGRGLTL